MDDIIAKFIENAKMYNEHLNLGNIKVADKIAKKLSNMSKKLIQQKTYFTLVDELLDDENPGVKYWVSSIALTTGYKREKAIKIIVNMSKNKNAGIISISAYITAEGCKEKGWIK